MFGHEEIYNTIFTTKRF